MIRLEHALTVRRFCELVGVPRSFYYRRRRREVGGGPARGPWPTPVLDRIDPLVAEVAAGFGCFGYRKVWGRLRLDGHAGVSESSVRRSMRRQGLLQPRRYVPIVDDWAKVALAAYAAPTKTTADAIPAIEAAIGEVELLLGRALRENASTRRPVSSSRS